MQRRSFLKKAGIGLAAGTVAAPAIVHAQPAIQWRLASSFPKNLDTLYGAAEILSRRVSEGTDGKFQIRVFAAGEIVPGLQVLDAVQNGTVQCGHTAPYYYIGKDPAFAFATAVPFGLNARQQNAWMYYGGGLQAVADLFKDYGCVQFPTGNTGVQMGGWYRKEIKTVADLKGLKFRIGGLGGTILSRLGVVPQQIPGGDIYSSLEKGTIDAAEWIGPYDDEKLGLHKVAKFYYYPGWWEGSAQITLLVNLKSWEALGKTHQEQLDAACAEQMTQMVAKYDAKNPEALRRLVANGAQLRAFPKPVMDACYKATMETFTALAEKDADFRTIYDSWNKFREDQNLWFRVAENSLDSYRYGISAGRK